MISENAVDGLVAADAEDGGPENLLCVGIDDDRAGPAGHLIEPASAAVPNRPMSVAHHALSSGTSYIDAGKSP